MFQDDIEFLVAQTFKEAEFLSKNEGALVFGEDESSGSSKEPDEVPGVLYYLQKNESTFVVRMHVAENLNEEWQKILAAPEDYPSLRLLNSEDARSPMEKLQFFECDSSHLAKILKAQLANKRFPLHEERIINVSDPGDNWWVRADESGLSVYFKLCRTESMESLVKVGPLGDCDEAMAFFNQLYGYFSLLFPVKDFSSAHGQLFLSCEEPGHDLFKELASVFLEGEIGNGLWEKLRDLEFRATNPEVRNSIRRANYFLMEISTLRSFWITIQESL